MARFALSGTCQSDLHDGQSLKQLRLKSRGDVHDNHSDHNWFTTSDRFNFDTLQDIDFLSELSR